MLFCVVRSCRSNHIHFVYLARLQYILYNAFCLFVGVSFAGTRRGRALSGGCVANDDFDMALCKEMRDAVCEQHGAVLFTHVFTTQIEPKSCVALCADAELYLFVILFNVTTCFIYDE